MQNALGKVSPPPETSFSKATPSPTADPHYVYRTSERPKVN